MCIFSDKFDHEGQFERGPAISSAALLRGEPIHERIPLTDTRAAYCSSESPQQKLANEVVAELHRAQNLFPPIHSMHEGLGIVREEYKEFEDEVFAYNLAKNRDTRPKARAELIQLATMALRTIFDTIDTGI